MARRVRFAAEEQPKKDQASTSHESLNMVVRAPVVGNPEPHLLASSVECEREDDQRADLLASAVQAQHRAHKQ